MVLVMIAILAASSPTMVACQTEESATNQEAATTTTTTSSSFSSSMGGLATFTTVAAWGNNFLGQLGNGVPLPYPDDSPSTMPVEVSNLDGAELKAITGGANHSLALKNDGTVLAWGLNQDGELGDGTNTDSSTPVEVNDPNDPSGYLTGVSAIAAGGAHSLALKSDGSVWAWGSNFSGQLGDGTTTDSSNKPVKVANLSGVEAISGGGAPSYNLALKDDGTVWAWGDNTASQGSRIGGQLGDDEISSSNTPLQVSDLPGGIDAIAAGAEHGLALKDDGTVWAWGYNFFGQLGNGTTTDSSSSKPVQVSELVGIKAIAAGGSFSLALKDDGTVWAWGDNRFGQLGDGTFTEGTVTTCEITGGGGRMISSCPGSNTPVQMSEVGGIEAIAAGGAHGLALKDDGTVWAWGYNQFGQLGNGTTTLSTSPGINTPVQVGNLSAVKAIAAGSDHSLAGW
jgi:alpha-tubulin suppressor-like RCC1 family protein